MADFKDKRVLITGGSRGIGRHLSLGFAAAGAKVVVNFQSAADAAQSVVAEITENGGEAIAVQADIGIRGDVDAMFDQMDAAFGGIDILVNNAGLSRDVPFLDMTDQDWDAVISTNLKGPFLCAQAAARRMVDQKVQNGRIINISAVTSLVGRDNAANFSASKGGVNALTRALAVELGPNITANAIALGFFDSPLVRELFTPQQVADVESKLPTNRMGTFDEVQGMVFYLASEAGAFVTGQTLSLDGGQIIRLP